MTITQVRTEETVADVRRQLGEERRLLDDERHARGVQHEQLVATLMIPGSRLTESALRVYSWCLRF